MYRNSNFTPKKKRTHKCRFQRTKTTKKALEPPTSGFWDFRAPFAGILPKRDIRTGNMCCSCCSTHSPFMLLLLFDFLIFLVTTEKHSSRDYCVPRSLPAILELRTVAHSPSHGLQSLFIYLAFSSTEVTSPSFKYRFVLKISTFFFPKITKQIRSIPKFSPNTAAV